MDTYEVTIRAPQGGVERHIKPFLAEKSPEAAKLLEDVDVTLNQPLDVTIASKKFDAAVHLQLSEVDGGSTGSGTFQPQP